MITRRKTLFISDLHLDDHHPNITQQFLSFLETLDASIDALYILGDLFEAWIGDDDHTPFHRKIIDALKSTVQKGIPVYFMRGNRDFLIGKRFMRETGCILLSDEEKITLYGKSILLMHGDTLCMRDLAYLKWRKKARNPILNTLLFLMWPLRFRRYLAKKMRAKSAQYTRHQALDVMDVTQAAVEEIMQKHDVLYLIHGHTHRSGIHHIYLHDATATRIVLSAWHDGGSVLAWEDNGEYMFKRC